MNIALFMHDEKIDGSDTGIMPILILRTSERAVVEVGKEIIVKKDINYLSLWLLTKQIKEIYVQDIDPVIKSLFEKLGITVRRHGDVVKNPLLKEFIS